jgi:hypothetical protein
MSLEHCLAKLDTFETFSAEHRENGSGVILGNHQLVPVFDAVENGLKRFALAYGTGAGKTIVPIEIIKHLQSKGKSPKTLVIAPKQTLLENWNHEVLGRHGCSMNVHHIKDQKDRKIPANADFVTVNYNKLNPSSRYLQHLVNFASEADLVIADEFHNIKNRSAKTSKGYQAIIDASKDARLVGLSASPCPDRLSDAGMMLYMLDPERFEHYKTIAFHIQEDPEALWEMRERGQIRFFDMESVAKFHNLPEFTEIDPLEVTMSQKYANPYFEAFKDTFNLGKLHNLERIAIEGMMHSQDTKEFLRERIKAGHTLNFFSHLIHEPKRGSPDEAIFMQLGELLKEVGAKEIATIRGATTGEQRIQIQKAMHEGKLDALINQWDCTSEGFSEIAGDRPVSIIPLRSPYSPGRFTQIIGRSYRPGQFAPVEYAELHAHSDKLLDRINSFVQEYAKENGVRIKSTWSPTLFHHDAYMIRKGKERTIFMLFNQRSHEIFDSGDLDINSLAQYAKRLSKGRIVDFSDREKGAFGSGTRTVTRFVGKKYGEGLRDNAEPLGKDYDRNNILLYTPGKINLFLAEGIEEIKEREGEKNESWRIADLGCCSSAVFTQARLLYQTLQSLKDKKVSLDHIVSVDGNKGFIRTAQETLKRGEWIDEVSNLRIPGFTEGDLLRAQERLRDHDYMNNLEFLVADFTKDQLGKLYDLVITSQCLQYNDQTGNRDIERIVGNINTSLREGGHYLTVLTGNSKTKSFTRPEDVESFKSILDSYGFELLKYGHISGKEKNKVVVKPFHYVHAVKREDAPSDLIRVETIPTMYSNTVEYLTGGYKEQRFRRQSIKTEETTCPLPDVFIDDKGGEFAF